ncbi:hypothetical protein [Microbacterium sp. A84]|uniref:hypothetical protein n=1 Tax=Microbacterium sp. A84 TaxID=3450715 RepID=UPI003F42420D
MDRLRRGSVRVLPAMLVCTLLLSGCTGSPAITRSDVAASAAERIQDRVDVLPIVDCGTGEIQIETDTEIDCEVRADETAAAHNAVVRITRVDDDRFAVIDIAVEPDAATEREEKETSE